MTFPTNIKAPIVAATAPIAFQVSLSILRNPRLLCLNFCVLRHCMADRTSKAGCSANEIRGLYEIGMATTTVRALDVVVNRE